MIAATLSGAPAFVALFVPAVGVLLGRIAWKERAAARAAEPGA